MQSVGLNNKELALFVRSVLLPVPLSSWCQWTMVNRCLTLSLLLLRWRPRQTTSRQCRPTLCSLPRPDNCRVELARQEPTFSADMVTRQLAYTLFRNRTKKRIIHRYLFMFVTAKYLSKQLRTGERERTGRRLLWSATLFFLTLLSDSQVLVSLVAHGLRWTVSGQIKAHFVLTCTNGVSSIHLPVILASDRPWTILSTRAH